MIGKRVRIICAFVCVISLGLPAWWKTTTVYRAQLPVGDVHAWAEGKRWPLFEELSTRYPASTHGRALKAATGYRLTFTLANADPAYVIPEWDFAALEKEFVRPILNKLHVIADFAVDSQVFHYASLMQPPLQAKAEKSYYIHENAISQHINPNEWKLDYSTDNQPHLNFIVYIPSRENSPLRIRQGKGYSQSNSFIIPQWGGVAIYNPPREITMDARANASTPLTLTQEDLRNAFTIFVAQLKELLSGELTPQLSSNEYDVIVRRHLAENLHTAAHNILSLSKLVEELPNMMVHDNIRDLVHTSVDNLHKAHTSLAQQDYLTALQASREALRTSQLAFFDSNMLSLLYFPTEHNFAIYVPLFLLVCAMIIEGVMQEVKHRRTKAREAREAKEARETREAREAREGNANAPQEE